jgi:hypothetical protein
MYLSVPMQHLSPYYYAFGKWNLVFELNLEKKREIYAEISQRIIFV